MNTTKHTIEAVLFQNDFKHSNNAPDFKGKLKIEGREFIIVGWKGKTKNGSEYISICSDGKIEPVQLITNNTDKPSK